MRRKILVFILHLIVLQLYSQTRTTLHPPLMIPMRLSGNFGEIRSNHFHSGIDIKTEGTTGHHVFAISEGYVSRIKVQANGYGKSIYLVHPDGTTSVYGHLDKYREDIAQYVNEVQYKRQSHKVDIYPDPDLFKVQRGAFIAYSGNSGGSFGPHLHFEVRNTTNQHPINTLKLGFDIEDHIAPKFLTLFLYATGEDGHVNGNGTKQSFDLLRDQGIYTVPWGTRIEAAGAIGLGVEVFDYLDGSANRCGVYTLEVYVDGRMTYSHVMDEFSFSETRYVNAHTDYGERIRSGMKVHRLYRLPNDKLRIYGQTENNGILKIPENGPVHVRIVATDVAGNSSELNFTIKGATSIPVADKTNKGVVIPMRYNQANLYHNGTVKVKIPEGALYEDLGFRYGESEANHGALTPFYHIHDPETPVHKPYLLSVRAPWVPQALHEKLVLITYDEEEDEVFSAGGIYKNGVVEASLREFGIYAVSLDTIAPEIVPVIGSAYGEQSGRKKLQFTVRDNLSGIEEYNGYIDNRWALFEYDPKNDLLTYRFDGERVEKNQHHELELYVSDSQGNVNLLHTSFTW